VGVAAVAPEHPVTTIALFAADSSTGITLGHVAVTAVLGVGLCALGGGGRLDPSTL
jgi:hypothetical protein